MTIRVTYFAQSRQATGNREEMVQIPEGATVAVLMGTLGERFPKLGAIRTMLKFAVNGEYAGSETVLSDGDEVALIPPVSGG
ncbi:MAG: molybdopterin converting factor subunit 1 [Candidatus Latescibacterota bacterium]